jgi:hypothetical protein
MSFCCLCFFKEFFFKQKHLGAFPSVDETVRNVRSFDPFRDANALKLSSSATGKWVHSQASFFPAEHAAEYAAVT